MRTRLTVPALVVSTAIIATSGGVLRAQATAAPGSGSASTGQDAQASAKLTFEGDTAIWTVAIQPDKTADFEKIMSRLHDALAKSSNPDRQKQAAGWKVIRLTTPLPDGSIPYVHIVQPVVPGADYTVMQILYDEFPDERRALYDMYRGAFAKNLSLATGSTVADMSTAPTHASSSPPGQ